MFCEHCGNKLDISYKFCTKCGQLVFSAQTKTTAIKQPALTLNDKWWYRLLKVIYILLYVPLLGIIPLVWSENSSSYNYFSRPYTVTDTSGSAFWYCLLTLVIYIIIARLIKISVLYISIGRKPEWKKEFKKLF